MIKKAWALPIVWAGFMTLLLVAGDALAAPDRVVSEQNEFGGKTIEKVYPVKDIRNAGKDKTRKEKTRAGKIQKDITYFDGKGKKVKTESIYTEQHTVSTGAERRILYYTATGELTKMEKFFSDSYAKLKGVDRMVVYYDLKKKQPRTEYYKGPKLTSPPQ
jgi:hypothetical protein